MRRDFKLNRETGEFKPNIFSKRHEILISLKSVLSLSLPAIDFFINFGPLIDV